MRDEQDLLLDCVERLDRSGIDYVLTGSMAGNYWGIPRSTHDLDFVLALRPADVARLIAAFSEGFFLQPESVRQALRPPYQFNALDELSALKADFWVLSDKAFDRELFARRKQVTTLGARVWIVTPEDLILHKLYWNKLTPSEQQLRDAAGIYAVQVATLDSAYINHWTPLLGVQKEWDDLVAGRIKPKNT